MHIDLIKNKKILYGALNWGLGHVTRSIGIIRQLLNQENEVIILCDKYQEEIFKSYFPNISTIEFPAYPFKFRGKNKWGIDIILSCINVYKHIRQEEKFVNILTNNNKYDLVISDHRYGLKSNKSHSIFITHQLKLPIPWYFILAQFWHQSKLNQFNFIWVLDDENSSLAGELSIADKLKNKEYIGWFSRFSNLKFEIEYDYLFVLSGVEIYKNDFLEIINKYHSPDKKSIIVTPYYINLSEIDSSIKVIVTNSVKDIDDLFYKSEIIISRCGYSTLMDLKILKKKAILIPSKGQHEQEYLSKLHKSTFINLY